MRLDQAQLLQRGEIVNSNVAGTIPRRQVFPVRADSDRSHTVSTVVRGVAFLGRAGGGQIHVLQVRQLRIYVEDLEQLVAVDVSLVEGVVRRDVLLEIPHADRVVAGAGDEAAGRHAAHRVRPRWVHVHAPDARRVIEERVRLAHPPDVSHVPHVDAVIVVNAGELVVSLVERQRDRVRVPRVRWMLGHVTATEK